MAVSPKKILLMPYSAGHHEGVQPLQEESLILELPLKVVIPASALLDMQTKDLRPTVGINLRMGIGDLSNSLRLPSGQGDLLVCLPTMTINAKPIHLIQKGQEMSMMQKIEVSPIPRILIEQMGEAKLQATPPTIKLVGELKLDDQPKPQ